MDSERPLNSRVRFWCFTLHFTPDDGSTTPPSELPDRCSYVQFQHEVCPDTQRNHYQGFMRVTTNVRMQTAKTIVMAMFRTIIQPHMEPMRGSVAQNIEYCSKVESRAVGTLPVVLGIVPSHESSGRPLSTPAIVDAILSKMTPLEALQSSTVDIGVKTYASRYYPTWTKILADLNVDRDPNVDPVVILLYGVPRSGKSTLAKFWYPNAFKYIDEGDYHWEGYRGESVVIYEDFDGTHMKPSRFKNIFDRYTLRVNMKGTSSKLSATTHIITTNVYPSHWWSKKAVGQHGRDAIWGRITQVWHFTAVGRLPSVYDDPLEFRAIPENVILEYQDPKGDRPGSTWGGS